MKAIHLDNGSKTMKSITSLLNKKKLIFLKFLFKIKIK